MTTISVPAGGLSLTGKVPVFEIVYFPSTSSLVLTTHIPKRGVGLLLRGIAPEALTFEFFAKPSERNLSFTTTTPFPFRERFVSPAIDTLALQGQAPGILINSLRLPTEESLTLSGKVPTVDTPDNRVGDPGRKQVFLFGEAPVTLTGTVTVIAPAKGTLAFSGKAPTASTSINLWEDPLVGGASLSGYAVTLQTGKLIIPAKGSLFLTGRSVATSPSTLTYPGTGTITLSGKNNYLGQATTLTLSGLAPSLITNINLTVGPGTLSFATKTPLVETLGIKAVPAYLARLQGQAPSLSISSFLVPGKGDIISKTVVRDLVPVALAKDVFNS